MTPASDPAQRPSCGRGERVARNQIDMTPEQKASRGRPAAHNGGLTADGVIHIKLPQVIKSDFVRRAQREGKTLSAWMVEAGLERLSK